MRSDNLTAALSLAEKGWYLLPVRDDKTPRLKDWYESSSCDPEVLKGWDRQWPGTAYGLHVNRSGLAVIDLDIHGDGSKNGIKNCTEFASGHKVNIWDAPCVESPSGGIHLYYKACEDVHRQLSFLPGVDIVATTNGFVMAPGMTVASGTYLPCGDFMAKSIPDLPECFRNGPVQEISVAASAPDLDGCALLDVFTGIASMPVIESGSRDNSVFRLVAQWKDMGFDEAVCLRLCLEMLDKDKIDQSPDPFGKEEFYRIIDSAFKRPVAERDDPLALLAPRDGTDPAIPVIPSFAFQSMAELRKDANPPRKTLIRGFMAHGKYLTLIYGKGGDGKSLLEMQMARELIRGMSFLGMAPGTIFDSGREVNIGILSAEEPREDVVFRYSRQSLRIDPEGTGREPVWCNLRGTNPDVFRANRNGSITPGLGYEALIEQVLALKLDVLFVDSLSRFFPGNENDRAAVTMLGILLDQFVERTGCHVIMLAHTNKAGAFSGSSSWEAICRQMFMVRSEKLNDTTVYTMTADKTNEAERGAVVRYKWDDWYFVPVSDEEYEALKEGAKSRSEEDAQNAKDAVMSILGTDELTYSALRKAAKEAGIDKGALDFAVSALEAEGWIVSETRYNSDHRRNYRYIRAVEEVGF